MADIPKFDETEEDTAVPSFDDTVDDAPATAEPARTGPAKIPASEFAKLQNDKDILSGLPQRTSDALANIDEGLPLSGAAQKLGALVGPGKYEDTMARLKKERAERYARNPEAAKRGEEMGGMLGPGPKSLKAGQTGTELSAIIGRIVGNAGVAAADKGSRADTLDQAAADAKKAGLVAGGVQTGFEALGGLGRLLKGVSEDRALKSLEPTLNQQKVIQDKGKARELGREMLDQDVVKFGSSVDDMAPRIDDLLSEKGQRIGEIRDLADQRGAKVDFDRLLRKGEAKEAFSNATNDTAQDVARAYRENAENFAKVPDRSIAEAQQEVRGLDQQIPFEKDMAKHTPKQQAYRELRGDIVDQTDDQIRQHAPESFDEYLRTKDQFGLYKDADKVLDTATARNAKNATLPMSSLLAAHRAAQSGGLEGGLKGAAAAVATKLAKERGNAAIAVAADRMSQILGQNPARLGRFMKPLVDAAKRGNAALMTTHALLMKDPEYVKTLEQQDNGNP